MTGGVEQRKENYVVLDLRAVFLFLGGVGKSCLMNRFVSNRYDENSFHTIGVEFMNKDLEVDGEKYTLQVCLYFIFRVEIYPPHLFFRSGTLLAKKGSVL